MKMTRRAANNVSVCLVLALLLPAAGCIGAPLFSLSGRTTGANVSGSNLSGSNVSGSNVTGANVTGSNVTGIRRANVTGGNTTIPRSPVRTIRRIPTARVEAPPVEAPVEAIAEAPVVVEGEDGDSTEVSADEATADEPAAAGAGGNSDPHNWTYCRGPEFNGISRETGLVDDFDPEGGEGSNVRWKRGDLGGRSTPVVMGNRLYLLAVAEPDTPRMGERVVCVDIDSGETIWENRFNVWQSDVPVERVGWSSVVCDEETGNVYALGVCGLFQCMNGETGETIWSVPMHERFGLLSTYGGRTNFPLIHEDLVLISGVIIGWGEMARPTYRFIAFDKVSGEVVWINGTTPLPDDTTYSAPVLAVINGQKMLIVGGGDGNIWAFQPRTGKPIWYYRLSRRGLNCSPLVVGDTVFAVQSEENITNTTMGAVVAIDGTGSGDVTGTNELWKHEEVMVGKSSPLAVDGRLYCFDDRAKLHIFDNKTGERVTEERGIALGSVMRANPLYADGKIYAFTAGSTRWYIMKPSDGEDGVEIIAKGRLPRGEEVDAAPIASHGKIFVESSGALYCLEDQSKEHGLDPRPEAPAEDPLEKDMTPALVRVVPAGSLLRPGQSVMFSAQVFNAKGQLLDEDADAAYEVSGPGEITDDGFFMAADEGHTASYVKAKVDDLTGSARLRTVPAFPWSFDFDDLSDPPVTWVGARYRHVIREVDGNKVMVKITTIPKGARSRGWMGHSDVSGYTIQAEVKGAISDDRLPDIGLENQGYSMVLFGASQELQIHSWDAQLRMASKMSFPWEPDVWYVMKFRSELVDDPAGVGGKKAILKGKLWPKGEEEPADWMLTGEDLAPQTYGSPGLFGNAKDAEIYLDNITVTSNE